MYLSKEFLKDKCEEGIFIYTNESLSFLKLKVMVGF